MRNREGNDFPAQATGKASNEGDGIVNIYGHRKHLRFQKAFWGFLVLSTLLGLVSVQCTLPATGQTQCYDNRGPVPCPAVGFPGQDAATAYNPLSYTLVSNVPGQETVIDDNTGLEWTQAAFPAMPWQQALQFCDSLHWGGYGDWRLPKWHQIQDLETRSPRRPLLHRSSDPDRRDELVRHQEAVPLRRMGALYEIASVGRTASTPEKHLSRPA